MHFVSLKIKMLEKLKLRVNPFCVSENQNVRETQTESQPIKDDRDREILPTEFLDSKVYYHLSYDESEIDENIYSH